MSKIRFTQGPWASLYQFPFRIVDASGLAVGSATRGRTLNSRKSRTETIANANLMAAAPELYEALNELVSSFDAENPCTAFEADSGCLDCTSGATPNHLNTGPCGYHKAVSALAKARGEANA